MIANRADGGILFWTGKLFGFAALTMGAIIVLIGLLIYRHYAALAPATPDLSSYTVNTAMPTHLLAGDGTPLGSLAAEDREVVAYDAIPQSLIDAFLAVEDHRFFSHRGIDFKGIVRAFWVNMVTGDFSQGGSTITQQVAKQFLGNDKSLDRKVKEAILARRLEATYSKQAILSLYLNHIYLGNGAYGVAAAARRYFSKRLAELDLAQIATIAGMAQAPSRYSPMLHPERAVARRNHVLDRMVQVGFLEPAEAEHAKKEPLKVSPASDVFLSRMPYFAEHVRRYLSARYTSDKVMSAGWRVETTAAPVTEALAYENIDFGAHRQDKRQGWRGPEAYIEGKALETFVQRATALYGDRDLEPGRRYLGVVDKIIYNIAKVRVGPRTYELHLDDMRWAAKWDTRGRNDETIWRVTQALKPGDVIWVSKKSSGRKKFDDWTLDDLSRPHWQTEREPRAKELQRNEDRVVLEQPPHPQAAILTADHKTGYVVAMVGGTDYSRSEYNRTTQACRQPGSTYKPIYYSAALDMGFGFDSRWNDKPIVEIDPETGEEWRPENLNGTSSSNKVSLEYALVFSKNLPSVDIFKTVGANNVAAWARRLGFSSKIIADLALALGASCTHMDELTRAFAIFARHGRWIDWVSVRRIIDRDGHIVEDNTVYYDPMLPPADRLDRVFATAGVRPKQVIPARAAFLMDKLLRQEVRHGFAEILRRTGVHAAGKTGTSSETMDTSFVGYTSRWITSVWMGDDLRQRPLGLKDAAFITVVPMWSRYMLRAADGHPNKEIPWTVPAGLDPDDRGGRKGHVGSPMELYYRWPKKPVVIEEDDERVPERSGAI